MCGIAGIFDPTREIEGARLRVIGDGMQKRLAHRGPDASGVWLDPSDNVVLAHRRLSIIDLSGGAQPMESSCGRFAITFNGEIYNFKEIRSVLKKRGVLVRDNSDTDVLLTALSIWTLDEALAELVGMFAFALWDKKEKKLTLARDRMGEKPLYYGWIGRKFVFASELKAFGGVPGWQKRVDRDSLALFFRHNYVPDPNSIFEGVYKLPAASYLAIDKRLAEGPPPEFSAVAQTAIKNRYAPQKYWNLRTDHVSEFKRSGAKQEVKKRLRSLLQETISDKLIADVPLGTLLSGGVDSSIITALSQEASNRTIDTFSIGFESKDHDEAQFAKQVAKHLGTNHHELYVTGEDALSIIPELPAIYEEPFADSSQIPTTLISRFARQSIKVALSGDGGDELFGGYNRYLWGKRLLKLRSVVPLPAQQLFAAGIRLFSPTQWNKFGYRWSSSIGGPLSTPLLGDKLYKSLNLIGTNDFGDAYAALVSIWPRVEKLVRQADPQSREEFFHGSAPPGLSDVERMMQLDALTYLPGDILTKVDRASMSTGLEVRAPLLDHRVVEFASTIPLELKVKNGVGKWILRQVLYEYVPQSIIDRPKMGFAVPLAAWLRGPLRDWAQDLLRSDVLNRQGFLNHDLVSEKWNEHLSGQRNWEHQLWGVLMFQSWLHAEGLA